MAKVGAQRAADLTGRSKSTIQRAMNAGKLSYEVDANGRRVIDVSELDRAFGLLPQGVGAGAVNSLNDEGVEAELRRTSDLIETERLKMRVKFLEEQLDSTKEQLDDAKNQRDQWQKQATQVLLTSQYSQKQAEELKAELVERDRRAKLRRQQELQGNVGQQVKRLKGQQAAIAVNKPANETAPVEKKATFTGLWQKIRGDKKVA